MQEGAIDLNDYVDLEFFQAFGNMPDSSPGSCNFDLRELKNVAP